MSVCRTCALEKECMLKYDVSARMFCNSYAKKKLLTNADRIRAMTDEELAEWLESRTCQWGWLVWLKQEVDDG